MNRLFAFFVVVLAVATCSSAVYHFKQKMVGSCDLSLVFHVFNDKQPNFYMVEEFKSHGFYVYYNVSTCIVSTGHCTRLTVTLFRPDLADDTYVAKEFEWNRRPFCQDKQVRVRDIPYYYYSYENWFTDRDPVTFHGVKCYKFYNSSDPQSVIIYGDDTTGELIGTKSETGDVMYNYTAASYDLVDFALSPTDEPDCDKSAYQVSEQKPFDDACKIIPVNASSTLPLPKRFW